MDVVSWRPVISRVESRPGSDNPNYCLEVHLKCLICGESSNVRTLRHELDSRTNVKLSTHTVTTVDLLTINALGAIRGPRSCELCGIVSGIPMKQFDELLSQVKKLITAEWIKKQILAPPLKTPKRIAEHRIIEPKLD